MSGLQLVALLVIVAGLVVLFARGALRLLQERRERVELRLRLLGELTGLLGDRSTGTDG